MIDTEYLQEQSASEVAWQIMVNVLVRQDAAFTYKYTACNFIIASVSIARSQSVERIHFVVGDRIATSVAVRPAAEVKYLDPKATGSAADWTSNPELMPVVHALQWENMLLIRNVLAVDL